MKYLGIVFLLSLTSSAFARRANFIESQLLRLSSQQNPTQWINPFSVVKHPQTFETNLLFSEQKDTYPLYKDISSKNQDKILNRLSTSYGKPYDAAAKVNFGFRVGNFSQFFSTNGGAVLLVTDPVFPELKGFLYHDYASTTAYVFRPHERFMLKPQLSYGVRKILDRQYTAGDLVQKSLNVKFNKVPYIGFVELGFLGIYSLKEWGSILFQLNGLPLTQSKYQYWDSFLGYKTQNFLKGQDLAVSELSLYGGYAPSYGGNYDVSRTYKLGAHTSLYDWIGFDLFTMDKFYPSAILSFQREYFSLDLFTFERAYDNFGNQKSRDFGLNIKFKW